VAWGNYLACLGLVTDRGWQMTGKKESRSEKKMRTNARKWTRFYQLMKSTASTAQGGGGGGGDEGGGVCGVGEGEGGVFFLESGFLEKKGASGKSPPLPFSLLDPRHTCQPSPKKKESRKVTS